MFTGIVQHLGKVQKLQKKEDALVLWVDSGPLFEELTLGASLCVNGTCLTVEEKQEGQVRLTAVSQTLTQTNLGQLQENDFLDLELSATLQTYMGGHLVSGHVDALAEVCAINTLDTGAEIDLLVPDDFCKYIIDKGSVTLDGISLTVASIVKNKIRIALIPETLTKTRAGIWTIGTKVNIEVDQVAKYVENFMKAGKEC